ncbi:MAG TPA: hypothetical protein DCS29_03325 [Candidatus Magasanikbacteria bacterium]|nr:MAG: hypothetical protein A2479_01435 [Candidatus Magasanikbacteria bacterium RIFOXYC2_FULL_39_8]HAT03777.1 hypothetical protein [Candidatus Magasanikbacteria bacterium]
MILGIDASRANNIQKTGVEWYAFHVIQKLKQQTPRDMRVVLYTDKPLQGEIADLPEGWTQKVLTWPPRRLWTQIRLSWEMLVHAPDILFVPAHVMPLTHPKKTVVMIHDIAAIKFPRSYNWFERWYSLWSARFALKHTWKMIVPSEFVKKELCTAALQHGSTTAQEKINVVYHGYDERYKKIDDGIEIEKILKKYSIEKPFIMSVGRLEEKKNTVRIIEAFNKLKIVLDPDLRVSKLETRNSKLLLVGKPGYGFEAVERTINESPFKNDIITPGFVPEEDLPYLMNAAEAFVFPSLYEGFGLPILEALSCGTPIVASKGSSLEEIGGDACVYVDQMDSEDIARGISEIMQNDELKMMNIKKGLERVKEFSWEKCARETLHHLNT